MGSAPSKVSVDRNISNGNGHLNTSYMQQERNPFPEPSPEMPRKLFKKQSAEAKKRFQHQMYLAKESPDPTFDISSCELTEIPSSVYSLGKVLQKEVLDVHNNDLDSLSEEIGEISSLCVLNLEKNKLKVLPETVGKLESLQYLNIKSNKLKTVPDSLCNLRSLKKLDISENNIHVLPKELCRLSSLELLVLDSNQMKFPPVDICVAGTESIMKFLCQESGTEYIPPSQKTPMLDSPSKISFNTQTFKAEVSAITETLSQYQLVQEKKKQEQADLEKRLEEEQRSQAELVANANQHKQMLLMKLAQEQDERHNEIMNAHQLKEYERRKLIDTLKSEEQNASRLVEQILMMNEKARKTEALLEAMEQERIEREQLFKVRKEEIDNLRQKEVLIAMENMLQESEMFDELIRNYLSSQQETARKSIRDADQTDGMVSSVLKIKEAEKNLMAEKLLYEETLQKEAFEMLLMQQDAKHQRLTSQIEAIEDELSALSVLEMEQREMRMDTQKNILVEKREALASLLMQLLKEKGYREEELKKRLLEMEEQKLDDQVDYWLVQYQRLMDRKPEALVNKEYQLEHIVIIILERASATEYIPQFARRKITIDTLCQMKMEDFKLMGVREGVRERILAEVALYMKSARGKFEKPSDQKKPPKKIKKGKMVVEEEEEVKPTPSAPPAEIIGRVAPECVVCLNNECNVIFLTCGHVCCCAACAEPITECPLCRGAIKQRIRLSKD